MLAELLQELENKFLSRREVTMKFKDLKGDLKRGDATEAVAQQLAVDKAKVFPIKINFEFGTDSAKGIFYIYNNPELAKKHLPKYLLMRSLPREERKKAMEEKKKKKTKQATPATKKK